MEEARELLLKHLYLQGGDGLGISDGRVYNACLDAIMEALTIPVVSNRRELLISFAEYLKERSLINVKKENLPIRVDLYLKRD